MVLLSVSSFLCKVFTGTTYSKVSEKAKISFIGKIFLVIALLAVPWYYGISQICSKLTLSGLLEESHVSEMVFSATLSLSGILLAVIGILAAIYWSGGASAVTRNRIRWLVLGVTALLIINDISCLMAFSYFLFQARYLISYLIPLFFSAIYLTILLAIMMMIVTLR